MGNISADIDHRFAWEPFLVRDRSVNAFALPGGPMYVNRGMLEAAKTAHFYDMAFHTAHVTQAYRRLIAANRVHPFSRKAA